MIKGFNVKVKSEIIEVAVSWVLTATLFIYRCVFLVLCVSILFFS